MRDSKTIFHDSNNIVYIHELVLADFDEAVENINKNKNKKSIIAAKKRELS